MTVPKDHKTAVAGGEAPGGATAAAIQAHYDLSNEFYRLWLDRNLVYSAAMWRNGDDLEAAQIRKIDHHIRSSRADHVRTVLDVGCGWGAVLRRLVEYHAVERAVGLTLSRAQKEWVDGLNLQGVEVHLEGWEDHAAEAEFGAIISIGALEHFARLEMDEDQKTAAYRRFFEKCWHLLEREGYLSLQTFAYGSARSRRESSEKESTRFLASEVFRETDPPRLANIAEAIEGHFEIVNLRNDRLDYAKTCKAWLDNLRAQRDAAVKLVGADGYERYQTYLSYSHIGFRLGNLDLYRITLKALPSRSAS